LGMAVGAGRSSAPIINILVRGSTGHLPSPAGRAWSKTDARPFERAAALLRRPYAGRLANAWSGSARRMGPLFAPLGESPAADLGAGQPCGCRRAFSPDANLCRYDSSARRPDGLHAPGWPESAGARDSPWPVNAPAKGEGPPRSSVARPGLWARPRSATPAEPRGRSPGRKFWMPGLDYGYKNCPHWSSRGSPA